MSRCKACDTLLRREESNVVAYKDKKTGVIVREEVCTACKTASLTQYDYLSDKEYQQPFTEFFIEDLTTVD